MKLTQEEWNKLQEPSLLAVEARARKDERAAIVKYLRCRGYVRLQNEIENGEHHK